jgi:hypothetical protein
MNVTTRIWGLWDCEELLSVHLTKDDARDARDEHLGRCRCFTDDQNVIGAAVEIRAIRLPGDPVPVENQDWSTKAGHHKDAVLRPDAETPSYPVAGPSHADR